jgi:hypothetical protein
VLLDRYMGQCRGKCGKFLLTHERSNKRLLRVPPGETHTHPNLTGARTGRFRDFSVFSPSSGSKPPVEGRVEGRDGTAPVQKQGSVVNSYSHRKGAEQQEVARSPSKRNQTC